MTRRGFAAPFILIGVLVLLLALGGAYYLGKSSPSSPTLPQPAVSTPTPSAIDQTANWERYQNVAYSIRYPSDFSISQTEPNIVRFEKWGPTQRADEPFFDGVVLSIDMNSDGKTAGKFAESIIGRSIGPSKLVKKPTPVTFAGVRGTAFALQALGTEEYIVLESPRGFVMSISYLVIDPGNRGYRKTLDQILSTFKFTQ